MTLRNATPADLTFLLTLEREYCAQGFLGSDDIRVHERQMVDRDCRCLIAEADGTPAGYVVLRGLMSANKSIELKRIAIATPGCGLGRQLLSTVIGIAFEELSAHRLWLDVFVENARARHLYLSIGFKEEGTLRECVRYGEHYRSLVIMSMLSQEYAAKTIR